MILSYHAREAMSEDGIAEEEVRQCLEHGELVTSRRFASETRYVKRIELKGKSIVVIYTFRNNEERVITTYILKNKKWQV